MSGEGGVPRWFKFLCVISVVVGIFLMLASFFFVENGPRETFVWLLLIGGALVFGCCIIDWTVYERGGDYAPGSGLATRIATGCCSCAWCWRSSRRALVADGPEAGPAGPVRQAAPFAEVVDVSKLRI